MKASLNDQKAAAGITPHHGELRSELRERVLTLPGAVRAGGSHDEARGALLDYLERELLPHAAAEEEALYPAGDTGTTALLIRAMRDEHRDLRHARDRVGTDTRRDRGGRGGEQRSWRSSSPTSQRRTTCLSPLWSPTRTVSLSGLLRGMHEQVG